MTEKYKKYLENCPVISEDRFNYIVSILPNYEKCNFNDGWQFEEDVVTSIVNTILSKWTEVYCEDVDINKKKMSLWNVQSLEDLEEIKKTFFGWTISNEEEIIENLKTAPIKSKIDLLLRKLSKKEQEELLEELKHSIFYDV